MVPQPPEITKIENLDPSTGTHKSKMKKIVVFTGLALILVLLIGGLVIGILKLKKPVSTPAAPDPHVTPTPTPSIAASPLSVLPSSAAAGSAAVAGFTTYSSLLYELQYPNQWQYFTSMDDNSESFGIRIFPTKSQIFLHSNDKFIDQQITAYINDVDLSFDGIAIEKKIFDHPLYYARGAVFEKSSETISKKMVTVGGKSAVQVTYRDTADNLRGEAVIVMSSIPPTTTPPPTSASPLPNSFGGGPAFIPANLPTPVISVVNYIAREDLYSQELADTVIFSFKDHVESSLDLIGKDFIEMYGNFDPTSPLLFNPKMGTGLLGREGPRTGIRDRYICEISKQTTIEKKAYIANQYFNESIPNVRISGEPGLLLMEDEQHPAQLIFKKGKMFISIRNGVDTGSLQNSRGCLATKDDFIKVAESFK